MKLALLNDFAEEGWFSMDLLSEQLRNQLAANSRRWNCQAQFIRPRFLRTVSALENQRLLRPFRATMKNVDRLLNRWHTYPRMVRPHRTAFDAFHVCDHSYAHLVHSLPEDRTGVCCCDLDAFRCLLSPDAEVRPQWFCRMMERVLCGLQKAAKVFCISKYTLQQIQHHGLVPSERLVYAPLGVTDEFHTDALHDAYYLADFAKDGLSSRKIVLNVGSCIDRKRIDVLLEAFAELKRHHPNVLLVQIGGVWTEQQWKMICQLQLAEDVVQYRGVSRNTLAAFYRQANVVVQPSQAEGFGLPLLEAIASGANVVASDLEVLREVGGDAALFVDVGDAFEFAAVANQILAGEVTIPGEVKQQQAHQYTWVRHAEIVATTYQQMLLTGTKQAA